MRKFRKAAAAGIVFRVRVYIGVVPEKLRFNAFTAEAFNAGNRTGSAAAVEEEIVTHLRYYNILTGSTSISR